MPYRNRVFRPALMAAVTLGVLSLAGPAQAQTQRLSTTTTIPPYTLGDGNTVDATVYMENIAAGGQSLPISHILFAPSCRTIGHPATCEKGDRFIYYMEEAVGVAGTKCAGTTFAIAPFAEGVGDEQGYYRLTPSAPITLDPANSAGNSDACGIKIKTSASQGPELDVDASQPEQQTYNALIVAGKDGNVPWDQRSYSTSTINRKSPNLSVEPLHASVGEGEPLFGQQTTFNFGFADNITFRLYGPGDPNCSGEPFGTATTFEDSSGGLASVGPFTPTELGTYRWVVHFGGNQNWKPVTTQCGAPGSTVEVKDITAPVASFAKTPKAQVRLRKGAAEKKMKFSLASSEASSSFECRLDAAPLAPCDAVTRVKARRGKHVFEAIAIDAAGNESEPIQHTFKVKKRSKR